MALNMVKEESSKELKTFKSMRELNWAWVKQQSDGLWKQFECLNCMVIESQYKKWQMDKTHSFTINKGTVNFSKMTIMKVLPDGSKE